jgi:hypothetical protein
MKSQDQILLEAAYQEVSNKVKDLYDQINPLAEKILGGDDKKVWDLDKEDRTGEFKHYSQFALKRITINAGSPKAYPAVQFGNWFNEQLWGSEINPHATDPKKYAAILEVLKKKASEDSDSSKDESI